MLSPETDKIFDSLDKSVKKRLEPIIKGIRNRKEVPYTVAMKNAVFREIMGKRILREKNQDDLLNMLDMPKQLDRPKRRIAAFLIGHASNPQGKIEDIINRLGAKLTGNKLDPEWRVRAEIAKAMGRIGHLSAFPFLIDSLTDPTENDPFVRNWVTWAIMRLKKLHPINWDILIISGEVNLEIAKERISPYEKQSDGVQSTVLLNYQEPYHTYAKAQFKMAVLYRLCNKSKKAISLFNQSIKSFIKSEITGGQLPFITQQIVAEIHFEKAALSTDNSAKSKELIETSLHTILSNTG